MTPMASLKIHLKTLTPIWTGGIDGTMDRIHETGLLGSLRWWYEAIMRGLGGSACDPSEHTCIFDEEKYRKSRATDEHQRLREAGVCDACQVFGATGWRRRFRLEIVDDRTEPAWNPPPDMLNVRPPDRRRGWFLPPGRMGTFVLRFTGDSEVLGMLASLLLFLEKWGNLGAKPQLGYGVFRIENRDEVRQQAQSWNWKWKKMGDAPSVGKLPDLRQLGFFRYQFQPPSPAWWVDVPGMERVAPQVSSLVERYGVVPITPALKNEWRFHRWKSPLADEVRLFGSSDWRERGEVVRIRSKIAVSWVYRSEKTGALEVRGFAWLPDPRWAAQAWAIVTDFAGWTEVLPKGQMEASPSGEWDVRSIEEAIQFLEGSLR